MLERLRGRREQRLVHRRAAAPAVGIAPLFLCAIEIERLTRLPHSLASSKLVRRTNSSQVKSVSVFSGPATAMK